jgi:hypothetical protein
MRFGREIRSGSNRTRFIGTGAAPAYTMVHLAMQEADEHGIDVVWLEHVTEEEYRGGTS